MLRRYRCRGVDVPRLRHAGFGVLRPRVECRYRAVVNKTALGCLILRCQESPRGPSEAGIHRSSLDNSGCNTAGDLGTVIFDRQRRATRVSFFTALGAGFENWLERNGSEGRF